MKLTREEILNEIEALELLKETCEKINDYMGAASASLKILKHKQRLSKMDSEIKH